jgi:two-component system, chemotaxis family, CheB/CheR fusion protein
MARKKAQARSERGRRQESAEPEAIAARARSHPVVGIGASAGGLEACRLLLKSLPPDTGLAFVLVQHLDPGHQSMLTSLLSKATEMPVTEVKEGMRAEPNHVYIIPPNTTMGILNGDLHLTARMEPGSRHMPIDHFLRSLAEDQGSGAIGVILSGAATDGTLGLKAIKSEGGITFAQEEKTAKYGGMPHSAIAAGCVDFVLSPERIARELARIGRHPYLRVSPAEPVPLPAENDGDLRTLFLLLRNATGVDFRCYKYSTLKRRIARRMVLHKAARLSQYLRHLRENPGELRALYEDILIHVTAFFREPETFQALKDTILPNLLRARPPGEPVRVWIPGCSTGEEAYSIAMVLLEHLGDQAAGVPIQIFGTDISEAAIERARAGTYSQGSVAEVSRDRLRRFFVKVNGEYQIAKSLREMCIFARQDLAADPPFSRMDLISCRNVLIYMGPVLHKKLMSIFHYALKPTGLLILGKSESISGFSDLFTPVGRKHKIYSKTPAESHPVFDLPRAGDGQALERAEKKPETAMTFDLRKEADRLVMNDYAPPGLIATENLRILQFRGDAAPFLSPTPGEASLSLLRMVRPELAAELRAAIHRARKQDAPVRKDGVPITRNGRLSEVSLQVVPIQGGPGEGGAAERYFLILFEEARVPETASAKSALSPAKATPSQAAEIVRLRRELQTTKAYLQSIIEEQEATNEELKSASEEVQSANEELQSTNEELETAKEELQSTNEELVTVNEQMHNRNMELAQLGDDLINLLGGVNIPIIMLGNDLRIRRFTPLAERLLNLVPTDVGRPIDHIRPNLEIHANGGAAPDLAALIREVIDTVSLREQEVQDREGHWYSMRLRPYRTADNKIDGAVAIFIDIHALKTTQTALEELNRFSTAVMESAAALVMATDGQGRIVHFNRACQQVSGYTLEEVQGKFIWELPLIPADEIEGVKAVYRRARGGGPPVEHETHWVTRSGGRRLTAWSTVAFPDREGSGRHVVRTGRDVTDQRLAEAALESTSVALRQSQVQLRTLTTGLLRAQEEERLRVSRELHDDISQKLTALTVEAETLARKARHTGGVSQMELRTLRDRLAAVSEDVRRTAQRLHPSSLEHLGLAPALKSFCSGFARKEGMRVRFLARNLPRTVPPQVALNLYRVVQEALSNVAKHSGARRALVSLSAHEDSLRLAVKDTGRGFDPALARNRGLGLINMDERVRSLGGSFSLQAKPGEGVHIEVRVPVGERNRRGPEKRRQ